MVNFGSLVRLAASAKAALPPRYTATPRQNLEVVNNAVRKLAATMEAYAGGLLSAAPIGLDAAALGQAMKNTIKDAKAIEVPSEAEAEDEAQEIVNYTRAELLPSMQAIIKVVKEKRDVFAEAKLQGTVMEEMQMIRDLTASLSQVLFEKAPKKLMEEGRALNDGVDAELAGVIEYYS